MRFCGNNAVKIRFFFVKMHFVVIIMVVISYVFKKEQGGVAHCVKIPKGWRAEKGWETLY